MSSHWAVVPGEYIGFVTTKFGGLDFDIIGNPRQEDVPDNYCAKLKNVKGGEETVFDDTGSNMHNREYSI